MRYEIVQLGAIEYAAKATKLGIPFMVSEERNNFLEQYRKNQKIFVAKQTMDLLDQKLLNFYHEAIGTEVTPEFPTLFDFVRSQTKNEKEFLNVAMQVKNSNEAKRFREYLEELDNEFIAGNIKKYKKLKDKYKNVIETSLNGFWRESESVTATISLGPFFSITCPVKTLDITIAPNLKLIRKVVKANITNRKLSFNY